MGGRGGRIELTPFVNLMRGINFGSLRKLGLKKRVTSMLCLFFPPPFKSLVGSSKKSSFGALFQTNLFGGAKVA